MTLACIGIHSASCSHLPIKPDAEVALQGHYINYKYVSTSLSQYSASMRYGGYCLDASMGGPKRSILNLLFLLGKCRKTSPSFDLVSIAL